MYLLLSLWLSLIGFVSLLLLLFLEKLNFFFGSKKLKIKNLLEKAFCRALKTGNTN